MYGKEKLTTLEWDSLGLLEIKVTYLPGCQAQGGGRFFTSEEM
jgi:hypothetical protein